MDEEQTPSHIVPFEHPFVEHYPDGLESHHFHHPDDEFNEHVHHHCHTDRPEEDILHHHHTLLWWADGTNWTHTTSSEISSDIESEPPADYQKLESIDKPQSHATCFGVIGILVLALLGGGVALLIFLLPPYPDDRPKECVNFPSRFGLNCEFRCHCFNLSEVCDKLTGHCESGCMSGWRGQDCQIIYSIFDKPTINAKSQSRHTATCSIFKLWYNISTVTLTVYNGTETYHKIEVPYLETVSTSDQRLNARISKAARIQEADNITFSFEFREDDCDLGGLYECQFDMVEQFNTSFANMSVFVQDSSHSLQIETKTEYVEGSMDNITCSLQLANPTSTVKVIFIDNENKTRNSTTFLIKKEAMSSDAKCTNLTYFVYQFKAIKELNGLIAKCSLVDELSGESMESDGSLINVTTGIVNVKTVLEPKHQVAFLGSTAEMFCHANSSKLKWNVIHLNYMNSSSSQKLISIYYNNTVQMNTNKINATIIYNDDNLNISYIFYIDKDEMVCLLDGEYYCDIEFIDDSIQTTNERGTVEVARKPMVSEFLVKDVYYSKSNHSFSCRATFDDNANGTVEIQVCSEKYYKSITDDPAFALKETVEEDFPGMCIRHKSVVHNFNFTQASNGTLLRCLATDHNGNMSVTTGCFPLVLQPPVLAKMIPPVLYARIGNATKLICSIHYRGYAWSTISIVQQNTTDSVLLLNVSSDGNVEPKNSRIYGSVNKGNEYINVTVSFDVSPGSGVCELNHTYSCDIQLNDASIGTIAADSLFILEIPVTDVRLHLQHEYEYGSFDWINCTVNTIEKSTASIEKTRAAISLQQKYEHVFAM